MGSTSGGIPYPDPGDTPDIPADMQALADAIQAIYDASFGQAWNTYTPTVGNTGGATFSTRTGYWRYLGPKLVYVNIYLNASGAGSGSGIVTITTPTSPDRSARQILSVHTESVDVSGAQGDGSAVAFTGGSGNVWDRIRVQDQGAQNDLPNLTGSRILSNSLFTITGLYREA